MKKEKISQKERVFNYIVENGSITSWEAIKEFGITRLSAIIFNLKQDGFVIEDEWVKEINRYGDYVEYKKYRIEA